MSGCVRRSNKQFNSRLSSERYLVEVLRNSFLCEPT
jgi:hypothetical protein